VALFLFDAEKLDVRVLDFGNVNRYFSRTARTWWLGLEENADTAPLHGARLPQTGLKADPLLGAAFRPTLLEEIEGTFPGRVGR
jgi:hypothetical protein